MPPLTAILTAGWLAISSSPAAKSDFRVSTIAEPPRWELLDPYQSTMTRAEFEHALTSIYSEATAWKSTITIHADHADVRRSMVRNDWPPYRFNFAATKPAKPPPTKSGPFWRKADSLPALASPQKPLGGLRIAIDPGHIGGDWAEMEARWFQIGKAPPVKEGELTLAVARLLAPQLRSLGARVTLVREELQPVTDTRPSDFIAQAEKALRLQGITDPERSYENLPISAKRFTLQWQSELYFYRASEIRDRARKINEELKPDLVLCLHFNAEGWGNPANPTFVPNNHVHILCNGTYSLGEFAYDDIRCELLLRLLQRIHEEEIPLCDTVARTMAGATGLPAYVYPGSNAAHINGNPYLYARNLLANRTYRCPVVFLEPYVMNHRDVFNRLQRLDAEDPNILNEYVNGVVAGLKTYYETRRLAARSTRP